MNHTPNYQLNQWEHTDRVLMNDFNEDNAKIDAALKAEAEARGALAAGLARKGNCQFYITSYSGNGSVGPAGARSLSFPRQPRIVFIAGNGGFLTLVPGVSSSPAQASATTMAINVSWSGSSVSWYGGSHGAMMMNESGVTYIVVALMDA